MTYTHAKILLMLSCKDLHTHIHLAYILTDNNYTHVTAHAYWLTDPKSLAR